MTFGKYKGTSVKEILTFDLQYILWCIDNIDNLMQRLDDADKQMLKYLLKPLEGIKSKKVEDILSALEERGILSTYSDYVDSNDDIIFSIDTIYGFASTATRCGEALYITESKIRFIESMISRWVKSIATKERLNKIFPLY